MRIDGTLPYFNVNALHAAGASPSSSSQGQQKAVYNAPGVIVDISEAYNQSKMNAESETREIAAVHEIEECETCKNRRYMDESSDPSVSFQSPQHVSPEASASQVMAHEREHIVNDREKAEREDRRVISQTVSISTSICPECGKVYVSGGSARTVTASDNKDKVYNAHSENNEQGEVKNAEL